MLFFDASLSLCSQKKMNDESVSQAKKKTVDWTISEVSLYLWMARDAEKKVNCILGSRQTDDLKTLFALDPGETKQRLMRL